MFSCADSFSLLLRRSQVLQEKFSRLLRRFEPKRKLNANILKSSSGRSNILTSKICVSNDIQLHFVDRLNIHVDKKFWNHLYYGRACSHLAEEKGHSLFKTHLGDIERLA